ncbi:hypothetical protein GCM10027568_22940 [Humibacter soli]
MYRHVIRPYGYHRLGTRPERWVDSSGERLTEPAELARLARLVIPPAWTNVWASSDAGSRVQATGVDLRGRTQYRYSDEARADAERDKFTGMVEFAAALPAIRQAVKGHLRDAATTDSAEVARSTAAVVRLLDRGLFRVGNERYARDNDTYGLTTLRREHVEVGGPQMTFTFVGKEHIPHRITVEDDRTAAVVGGLLRQEPHPEGRVFALLDPPVWRLVDSATVNSYLHTYGGCAATAKVFRTWGATVAACTIFAGARLADPQRTRRNVALYAYDGAAQLLGDTPTVARASYVHPDAERIGSSAIVKTAVGAAIDESGTDDFALINRDDAVQAAVLRELQTTSH